MRKIFIFILCIVAVCAVNIEKLNAKFSKTERAFIIEERISFKNLPSKIDELRIWVPYPVVDSWQTVEDFKLAGPFDYNLINDNEYDNVVIYLRPKQGFQRTALKEIILSFKVARKECCGTLEVNKVSPNFIKSNNFELVNGRIRKIAKEITQGKMNDLEKVRAIYDYIIGELTYSKDNPKVCGLGNSILTLKHKKGICTDYHSLFISLVRSLGISAKFEIGFGIPENAKSGKINGYHCWAKFYIKGMGWVPVDISEADKHPERREYFFGSVDENRIHLTSGRNINLKYAKDSKPLNFFIYPYAEIDGLKFNDMDIKISYKELKGGG